MSIDAETVREDAVDEAGVVAFTQELVRTRSVYDEETGGSEQAAAELVVAKMREFGWEPEVVEVAPGRPNVVCVVEGGGGDGPTLGFEGHTDVVTEGSRDAWTVDPFGGEIRDGRLYGRGATDMKSGLAAMLYATRALQQAGPFPGRVQLCVMVDEECLMIGAKHFAASPAARGIDGCIVCEPLRDVCCVVKGAIRMEVLFTGRMSHGAMPLEGRNPIAAAACFTAALAEYEARLQREHPAHELLGMPFVTPTVFNAGTPQQLNVVPATAHVCIDIRSLPGIGHGEIRAQIEQLARASAAPLEVVAEVSTIDDRPPVDTPRDHPVVTALAAAHEAVVGTPPGYGGVPGTTDGTIFTHHAGIPTVVYGPGDTRLSHQADESVAIEDIVRCTHVYVEAARRFLGTMS